MSKPYSGIPLDEKRTWVVPRWLKEAFVAFALARHGADRARGRVLAWCALGITDLVVAVACGFLSAPSAFQQLALDNPNAAITGSSLVLIPTFAVPVSMILHVYVIARLRARADAAVSPAQRVWAT